MEKKIYTIKIGGLNTMFSESKEDMLKAWEVLQGCGLRKLRSEHDWDNDEKYYWPEELKIQLEAKTVYLHENEEKAMKAKAAYKHAKKVGIISKKKKKT